MTARFRLRSLNVVNDDGVEPYWLDEKDWLVTVVILSGSERHDAVNLDWIGRLFGFAQVTDTRMLALVGDPEGPTYALLFSFSSEENKNLFLELVRIDGYAHPAEDTFDVPTRDEIEEARPLGTVFPEKQAEYIVRIATVTAIGLQTDANNSDA
jgi:hypothetical protein